MELCSDWFFMKKLSFLFLCQIIKVVLLRNWGSLFLVSIYCFFDFILRGISRLRLNRLNFRSLFCRIGCNFNSRLGRWGWLASIIAWLRSFLRYLSSCLRTCFRRWMSYLAFILTVQISDLWLLLSSCLSSLCARLMNSISCNFSLNGRLLWNISMWLWVILGKDEDWWDEQ